MQIKLVLFAALFAGLSGALPTRVTRDVTPVDDAPSDAGPPIDMNGSFEKRDDLENWILSILKGHLSEPHYKGTQPVPGRAPPKFDANLPHPLSSIKKPNSLLLVKRDEISPEAIQNSIFAELGAREVKRDEVSPKAIQNSVFAELGARDLGNFKFDVAAGDPAPLAISLRG